MIRAYLGEDQDHETLVEQPEESRSRFRFSAWEPAILTELFRDFHQLLQVNVTGVRCCASI
jgi:hypothetical protein